MMRPPPIATWRCLTLAVATWSVPGCASGGGSAATAASAVTFDEALAIDSGAYNPGRGFAALAEPDWGRDIDGGPATAAPLAGTRWRLAPDCVVRFDEQSEALAASEGAPFPTRRLGADACHGHAGFWQQVGGRAYWWMGLSGGWSVEYYATASGDSLMTVRRYALRAGRVAGRQWRAERGAPVILRPTKVRDAVAGGTARGGWEVTRALRAIGEVDWATRPGAGSARSVAGTRWRDRAGCILTFGTDVLAAARGAQRLTRSLQSATCGGVRGSWQQHGKRVFWRVNHDSLTGAEVYADLVSDTLLRARHFELRRASTRDAWQANWVPAESRTLARVRR
jgi:hypothetical protein